MPESRLFKQPPLGNPGLGTYKEHQLKHEVRGGMRMLTFDPTILEPFEIGSMLFAALAFPNGFVRG